MNRTFNIIMWGTACVLILGFVILIASMIVELGQESFSKPPRFDELSFAIKLSLLTATIASVMAILISIPVAYLFSRYTFFGKNFLDTLLDLPIVLSPIALGAVYIFRQKFSRYAVGSAYRTIADRSWGNASHIFQYTSRNPDR